MLQHLLAPLAPLPLARAALAAVVSLVVAMAAIPWLAAVARRRRYGDREGKSDSDKLNELHQAKRSTPIVGGLGILAGTACGGLLLADLGALETWLMLGTLVGLGALGLVDDWTKTFGSKQTQGLTPRQKLAGQLLLAAGLAAAMLGRAAWGSGGPELEVLTRVQIPFLSGWALPVGALGFAALTLFLVTGSSNAVNLTDGLDGLAGGCALVATGVYATVALLSADPTLAARCGLVHLPGAAEVGVVLGALLGGLTAFLVFNRHPARVFMGDAGSLPLGGLLALAAILTKQELLLGLVGAVFVAEALSVMAQVASFKLTGKRVLRCAPLHHHFEFQGWRETQIVTRFHAAALVCAALALAGFGVA